MPTVRRRFVVSGRVQGVFFRASARDEAQRLDVAGSARNLSDGTVEVVAEGEEAAVEQLEQWLRHGPARAEVTHVDAVDEPPTGTTGFRTG